MTEQDALQAKKDKLVSLEEEINRTLDDMRVYGTKYRKANNKYENLKKPYARLRAEIEGLETPFEKGLYSYPVGGWGRQCGDKRYIWVSSVKTPRKYTYAEGLTIEVKEGNWNNVDVNKFKLQVQHLEQGAIKLNKLGFLTKEGFHMEDVVDTLLEKTKDKKPLKADSYWGILYLFSYKPNHGCQLNVEEILKGQAKLNQNSSIQSEQLPLERKS